MTAFVRVSHRKVEQLRAVADPGRDRQPEQRVRARAQRPGRRRFHLHANAELAVRSRALAFRARRPARNLRASGGPACSRRTASPACRPIPRFAGGLTEQGVTGWTTWGRQNSNPQFQDPSVLNPRINYSWVKGAPELQDRLRVPGNQHEDRRLQPEVRPRQLRRPVQPAGRAPGADPATYNLADFMFGARNAYSIINPFIANLRQRMHFALPAGRHQGRPGG